MGKGGDHEIGHLDEPVDPKEANLESSHDRLIRWKEHGPSKCSSVLVASFFLVAIQGAPEISPQCLSDPANHPEMGHAAKGTSIMSLFDLHRSGVFC